MGQTHLWHLWDPALPSQAAGQDPASSKARWKSNVAFRFVPLLVCIPWRGRTDWFNVQGSVPEDAAGRKDVINYLGETFSLTPEVHLLNSYSSTKCCFPVVQGTKQTERLSLAHSGAQSLFAVTPSMSPAVPTQAPGARLAARMFTGKIHSSERNYLFEQRGRALLEEEQLASG